MGLSHTVSEIDGDSSRKSQIFPTSCILCPAEWVHLGIRYRCSRSKKLEWWAYRAEKEVWRYLQLSGYNTPTCRTDRRTDTGRPAKTLTFCLEPPMHWSEWKWTHRCILCNNWCLPNFIQIGQHFGEWRSKNRFSVYDKEDGHDYGWSMRLRPKTRRAPVFWTRCRGAIIEAERLIEQNYKLQITMIIAWQNHDVTSYAMTDCSGDAEVETGGEDGNSK